MLWTYLIHLGSNMWGEPYSKRKTLHFGSESSYQKTMRTEREVWRKVTDFIAEQGINTLLILAFVAHVIRHDLPLNSIPVIGRYLPSFQRERKN